jgi:hypothetical protein
MAGMFDYDWFTGTAFEKQREQARQRCTARHFPDASPDSRECKKFHDELEVRTLIYLRDGFSYEMKELVDVGIRNLLTFECEPLDDQYKVGAFVVSVLFEEIVRVEVFGVHPKEKPEDMPLIQGFRTSPSTPMPTSEQPREENRE